MNYSNIYKSSRLSEYTVFFYRLILVYIFYQIARLLFYLFNTNLLKVNGVAEYLSLAYHGTTFDTISILYVNLLFTLLSILPLLINTNEEFQKIVKWSYFVPNLIAYITNFGDFIYFRYINSRTNANVFESLEHEGNKTTLFFNFLSDFWYVTVLFITLSIVWIWLYNQIKIPHTPHIKNKASYFITSSIIFVIIGLFTVAGMRGGDLKRTTRPYDIVNASEFVKNNTQTHIVLNTPFTIMKSIGQNEFKHLNYTNQAFIDSVFVPIKHFKDITPNKKNVVLFIMESFSSEYIGCYNKDKTIKNYQSYTPFLDSLSQHSLIFTNNYANGYKSIHAMASVLASIPSFKNAYTSSAYVPQPTQSLVSTLNDLGYDTSFFHGAPNGSMGFLSFANILGYDHYYGKTEFNDDSQFDGYWGIWDEPFFQFMNSTLSNKKSPFMATVFSVSSHHPYIIPKQYKDKFPKGFVPIHQTIGYSDHALKHFFDSAKKEPWFDNTIFVITGDHGNQVYYDYYTKAMNLHRVPIIIYEPKGDDIGGIKTDISQQLDIYPTILYKIGYNKPFRSWGRCLLDTTSRVPPFAIRYNSNIYQYVKNGYTLTFDGKGQFKLFEDHDYELLNDISSQKPKILKQYSKECKGFIQLYMNSILDHKLDYK